MGPRLIAEVAAGILLALVTAAATYTITTEDFAKEIDQRSREAESYKIQFEAAQKELGELRTSHAQLEEDHAELDAKYTRCTKSTGKMAFHASIDESWKQATFSTGDSLQFKLNASSIDFQVLRVAQEGPVVHLNGCDTPVITEGISMPDDGQNSFLLTPTQELVVAVSTDCCDLGFNACDDKDVEEISVSVNDFDTEGQNASLRYRKLHLGV